MATLIFETVTTNGNVISIVALDDEPMNFLVRINGNIRPMSHMIFEMGREAARVERGPITA